MWIFYGERDMRTPVGFVADACPSCRNVTAFRVSKVNRVTHIYYFIKLGAGQNLGHERQCLVCNTRMAADTHRYAFIRPSNIGLDDLRAITFPNLDEFYETQQVVAQKIASAPATLSDDERAMALRQPFAALAPIVQKKFAQTILDRTFGLALLAWIAALVVGFTATRFMPESKAVVDGIGIIFLGGLVGMFIAAAGGGRRYIRGKILPAIADAVRPLRPSEEEISRIVDEYKRRKLTIGKRVRTKHLMLLINAEPAAASPGRADGLAAMAD